MNAIDALAAENARLKAENERLRAVEKSFVETERLAYENRIQVHVMDNLIVRVGPAVADAIGQLKAENERLTAELAQARQWAGLWKESAHNFRRVAAMWRSGALRAEALVAAADDERLDLAPVYDEETG